MGRVLFKPDSEVAPSTLRCRPTVFTPKMHMILDFEIGGLSPSAIGKQMMLSPKRINQIQGSMIYREHKDRALKELHERVLNKKSDEMVAAIDPVIKLLREEAIHAANEKIRLSREAKSEFVRSAACGDILDRAGYKPETKQTVTSVEVTDDMANRWEKTLRKRTIRITETEGQ